MNRRHFLPQMGGTLLASSLTAKATGQGGEQAAQASGSQKSSWLELKTWYLHNSNEGQAKRLGQYLQAGLTPALNRAGAKLQGAFSNMVGGPGPLVITLAEYPSLETLDHARIALNEDEEHAAALKALSAGGGAPFQRVESSLLRSFDARPKVVMNSLGSTSKRVFEMRTYESPSYPALARKIRMFNESEVGIFERLKMGPVFYGEVMVGPHQPCLTYMLSYSDVAAREQVWKSFIADPEWKRVSGAPDVKDSEIVSNITNVYLTALPFSPIQ